jgi:DNA repair exonuclease SbcCD ATPase subunit
MSAPITEAHRKLACDVLLNHSVSGAATKDGVIAAAHLIADSEARAKQSLLAAYDVACAVRNRLTAERDQLRDRLAEAQQREATAIASWDEERNRALREGGRVVEWRDRAERAEAEVERLKAALAKSCDDEREMSVSEGFPHGVCGLAEELTARAERAEAELEEARKETCITQSMETPTMKTYSPIQGMHVCSNDTGDYVGKADYDKIEAELAKYVQHEPNLLNTIKCMEHQILAQQADLAFERARLDWLLLDNVTRFEVSYHDRAAIDAAMKEGA